VTYQNTASRIESMTRPQDHLWVRDNTHSNIGFGAACNELAARGQDPIIVFVNPDGDPLPGCFDRLEDCVSQPGVVAVEADLGPKWNEAWEPRTAERDSWLSGACLAVRRDAFEAVGGFDGSLFLYYEDVDLSWKLAKHGRLVRCREATFLHDKREGSSHRIRFYQVRNKLIVFRRWNQPWGPRVIVKGIIWHSMRGHGAISLVHATALASYAWRRVTRPNSVLSRP